MHEFDAYWKESGRVEPRDSTVKEQMRIAFRAGYRDAAANERARIRREWTVEIDLIGERQGGTAERLRHALDRICPEEP
jgi:hypothetical protein